MLNPLAGIEEKIKRADVHFEALERETRAFIQSDPHDLVLEPDPQSGEYVVRAYVREEPPLLLGAILGDFVHNLRSALDHLVWQIVLGLGKEPGRWTCFPIYDDSDDFRKEVVRKNERDKPSPLRGVNPTTLTIIERMQPYNRLDNTVHGLAVLRDLSNIDKHQVVHASFVALTDQPPVFDKALPLAEVRWRTSAVHDGAELVRLRFQDGVGDNDVKVKARIPVDIRFGEMQIPRKHLPEVRNATVATLNFFIERFGPVGPA